MEELIKEYFNKEKTVAERTIEKIKKVMEKEDE